MHSRSLASNKLPPGALESVLIFGINIKSPNVDLPMAIIMDYCKYMFLSFQV